MFNVTSAEQMATAAAVMSTPAARRTIEPFYFDAYRSNWCEPGDAIARRTSQPLPVIIRSARMTSRWVGEHRLRRPIIVVGQDFALTERAVIAAGRRAGAAIVLIPDGTASNRPWRSNARFQPAKTALDRALGQLGALEGERGRFGGSHPGDVPDASPPQNCRPIRS